MTGQGRWKPKVAPLANSGAVTAGGEPFIRPETDGSITQLRALTPIRVATQRPLEGKWSGTELDAHRVIPSLFGGRHFILQLGYMQKLIQTGEGEVPTFRIVFVVNLPVDDKTDLKDPAAIADASASAQALIHMLNLRRMP